MEVVPGIHLIDGVRGANSYLVSAAEGAAVIDTGLPGNEKKIVEYATKIGVDTRTLRFIILTHPDIDHSGSVARLRSMTGAKVAIHELDAPRLSGEKKLKEVKGGIGIVMSVMSPFMRFTPVEADVLLKDSDKVLDLTVVHTPGHTDGSICLYRENQAIFVGDALRTDSNGRPHLPSGSMTADMERARESVRKISSLRYAALLPGHGPPIASEASTVLADYVGKGFAGDA